MCSGLCESQSVLVRRGGGCVWCNGSDCTNFTLRDDVLLQLLLIRKSIWVGHRIVYVVHWQKKLAQMCVCVCVCARMCVWVQLTIHLFLFLYNSAHGDRQWEEVVTNLSLCTYLIKIHHLSLFWHTQQQACPNTQLYMREKELKKNTGQFKSHLHISQLFTWAFLGSVSWSPVRPLTTGGSLFSERQNCNGWKIRHQMKNTLHWFLEKRPFPCTLKHIFNS